MRYEKTALRLREAMSDMNMTQQELANKSNVGKSNISHYINGSNEPGNKIAASLAEVLHVNPVWLMGLDAPKHIPADIVTEEGAITDSDAEKTRLKRALDYLNRFEEAPAEVQSMIEYLLKSSQSDT